MFYNSIIISGLPGSGKSTLAQRLCEQYQWPIHSIGQVFRDRWSKLPKETRGTFEDWWKNVPLNEQREVNVKMERLVEQGNIIGDTRYAPYCKKFPALLLFVTAPLEVRAKRAHGSPKYIGHADYIIADILTRREQDELKMGQRLFSYNYRD